MTIGRIDMVSGPTGRRRWSDETKGRLVAESYSTELSVSEFARRNRLVPSQLFGWRRDAKAGRLVLPLEASEGLFAPVLLEETSIRQGRETPPEAQYSASIIELEVDGVVVRIADDTPAERIGEIARALKARG